MKNCHTCRHIEWLESEEGDPAGWVCNKREYQTPKAEDEHLANLSQRSYREKPKRCHEAPNVEFSGGAPLHGAASAGTKGYASEVEK